MRSARASGYAWAKSISARAGIPGRRSACSRPQPVLRVHFLAQVFLFLAQLLVTLPAHLLLAAGAARALSLDADATVHALGIAGTQSSGLMAAQYGAMVKRMHAGRAARNRS